MKTILVAAVGVMLSIGAANAQYGCPYGYYFASDGHCYPNQPTYQPYVAPPVIEFGWGFGGRDNEHRGDDHHHGDDHHWDRR